MITSTSNAQVKELIQLQKKHKARETSGFFVMEGKKIISEVPAGDLEKVFYVPEQFETSKENQWLKALQEKHKTIEFIPVATHVMKAMSDTNTPQGIMALAIQPNYQLQQLLGDKQPPHLLLLERLQDPGNLGTIFRTAEGAGITGIIMSKDTVDLFHPKTVRSTMGSIYRVPFLVVDNWEETVCFLKKQQITFYASDLAGSKIYDTFDFTKGTAFFIGNEGNGLTDATKQLADEKILIPMEGELESLNVAMAAGILMYETNRQRRNQGK